MNLTDLQHRALTQVARSTRTRAACCAPDVHGFGFRNLATLLRRNLLTKVGNDPVNGLALYALTDAGRNALATP